MEKKFETKLRLKKETVKSLTTDQLGGVAGGSYTSLGCPEIPDPQSFGLECAGAWASFGCLSGSGSGGGSQSNCMTPT